MFTTINWKNRIHQNARFDGIERDGTGIERDGTGIERDGTGVERDGTGIERDGTGIHRVWTHLLLACCVFAASVASAAQPVAVSQDNMLVSVSGGQVSVSLHAEGRILIGKARINGDYSIVELFEANDFLGHLNAVSDGSGAAGEAVSDGSGAAGEAVSDGSGIAAVSDGSGIAAVSDGSGGIKAVSDGSGGIKVVSDGSGWLNAVSDGSGAASEAVSDGSGFGSEAVSDGSGFGSEAVSDGSGFGSEAVSDGSGFGSEAVSDGSGATGEALPYAIIELSIGCSGSQAVVYDRASGFEEVAYLNEIRTVGVTECAKSRNRLMDDGEDRR